ncbi:hypothetical protein NPIL_170601 [Nephila pilipes]|uniref:Uncharacterized protein n=1 Tax=Nephila pilipes TaxID=299642 RepID=A0A8X6PG43_NEPPI|nr:hypothetical protein NPIL_170601 [Nephila pilipes]
MPRSTREDNSQSAKAKCCGFPRSPTSRDLRSKTLSRSYGSNLPTSLACGSQVAMIATRLPWPVQARDTCGEVTGNPSPTNEPILQPVKFSDNPSLHPLNTPYHTLHHQSVTGPHMIGLFFHPSCSASSLSRTVLDSSNKSGNGYEGHRWVASTILTAYDSVPSRVAEQSSIHPKQSQAKDSCMAVSKAYTGPDGNPSPRNEPILHPWGFPD